MLKSDELKENLETSKDARDKVKKISAECKDLYDKYWRLYSSNWTEYEKMKVICPTIGYKKNIFGSSFFF
jgi:hypothetical protein